MLRTSKRKVTALLCAASALCVTGATLALTNEAVKVEAAEATYGYNVQFQDDFNDGQLKEGWEYVTGELSGNAVSYDGASKSGKMLYDTGATEYAISVDITLGLKTQTTTSTDEGTGEETTTTSTVSPYIYMPVAVTNATLKKDGTTTVEASDCKIGQGISLCFIKDGFKFWDFYSGSWAKKVENTSTDFKIFYKNIPGYSDTWLTEKHNWKTVVGKTYIECYVDNMFVGYIATPDFLKTEGVDSLMCGIAGGTAAGTVTYDDFTVWTKDSANKATATSHDFSKVIENQTVNGTDETDGTPLVSAMVDSGVTTVSLDSTVTTSDDTTGKAYKTNSHWMGTETFTDFTMTIDAKTLGTQMYSGIYFGATETDGAVSGYRLAICNGDTAKLYLYNVTDETDLKHGATVCVWDSATATGASGKAYDKDYPVILAVEGNKIILSYTDGNGAVQTYDYPASSAISGCMGLRLTDSNNAKVYKATFSMAVSTLNTESTDALTKATVTSVTDSTKRVYSVRKNTTMGLDSWSANAVAFVGENNALNSTLAIGDTAVEANILALDGFGLRDGASVRLPVSNDDDTKSGIRFTAELAKAEYAALADYGIDVSELGMLIMKQEMSEAFTLTTANVKKAVTDKIAEVNGSGTYIYRATLTGIPNTDYETKISARGYITLTLTIDGEETTKTIYTAYDVANNSRSIQEVAIAAETEVKATFQDGDVAYEQWEAYVAGNAQ